MSFVALKGCWKKVFNSCGMFRVGSFPKHQAGAEEMKKKNANLCFLSFHSHYFNDYNLTIISCFMCRKKEREREKEKESKKERDNVDVLGKEIESGRKEVKREE